MMMSSKNQKKSKPVPQQEPKEEETPQLGLRAFFGIALVAGALFNVPSMKVPQTKEDVIFLVIVLVMGLAGALLLLLPTGKD